MTDETTPPDPNPPQSRARTLEEFTEVFRASIEFMIDTEGHPDTELGQRAIALALVDQLNDDTVEWLAVGAVAAMIPGVHRERLGRARREAEEARRVARSDAERARYEANRPSHATRHVTAGAGGRTVSTDRTNITPGQALAATYPTETRGAVMLSELRAHEAREISSMYLRTAQNMHPSTSDLVPPDAVKNLKHKAERLEWLADLLESQGGPNLTPAALPLRLRRDVETMFS